MILTKEQLLARRDRRVEMVQLGADSVFVRSLTVREQLALEASMKDAEGERLTAVQLAAFLSDGDGNALLTADEALSLLDQGPDTMKAILTTAHALNGYSRGEDAKGN